MKEKCPICGNEQDNKFAYCQNKKCVSPMDKKVINNRKLERKEKMNSLRMIVGIGCLFFPAYFIVYTVLVLMNDTQSIAAFDQPFISYFSFGQLFLSISLLSLICGSIFLIKRAKMIAIATIITIVLAFSSSLILLLSSQVFMIIGIILVLCLLIFSSFSGYLLLKWHMEEINK